MVHAPRITVVTMAWHCLPVYQFLPINGPGPASTTCAWVFSKSILALGRWAVTVYGFMCALGLLLPPVMLGLGTAAASAAPAQWSSTLHVLWLLDTLRLWCISVTVLMAAAGVLLCKSPAVHAALGVVTFIGLHSAKTAILAVGPSWASQLFIAAAPRLATWPCVGLGLGVCVVRAFLHCGMCVVGSGLHFYVHPCEISKLG